MNAPRIVEKPHLSKCNELRDLKNCCTEVRSPQSPCTQYPGGAFYLLFRKHDFQKIIGLSHKLLRVHVLTTIKIPSLVLFLKDRCSGPLPSPTPPQTRGSRSGCCRWPSPSSTAQMWLSCWIGLLLDDTTSLGLSFDPPWRTPETPTFSYPLPPRTFFIYLFGWGVALLFFSGRISILRGVLSVRVGFRIGSKLRATVGGAFRAGLGPG